MLLINFQLLVTFAFSILVGLIRDAVRKVIGNHDKALDLHNKAKRKREAEHSYFQKVIKSFGKMGRGSDVESVTRLNGPALLQQYRSGKLEPMYALQMYLYKACCTTKRITCVTEILKNWPDTVADLSEKDPTNLPLYGIPVTLKENFETKGTASTLGCVQFLDNMAKDDCVLVKVLKHCGAVPFAKTNLCQLTMSIASSNPIYGETLHPANPDFMPGGSSSGEAAMISAGASVLGFGNDTGSSIRCPAHFCGICGLKPTSNRLSTIGLTVPNGMTTLRCSPGPMAKDVDTIVMAMEALCCDKMFELDSSVAPIKFRHKLYVSKKSMRIGYFDDNGYAMAVPACRRAVNVAKEALERIGHILIPFKVPGAATIMDVISEACFGDGGQTSVAILKDDIVDKCFAQLFKIWTMPSFLVKLYAQFLQLTSKRLAKDFLSYAGGGDKSAYNFWKLQMKIREYKATFWKEWQGKHQLDALICPAYPIPSCPRDSLLNTSGLMTYTVLFNVLDYPAGVVPVSKVNQRDIDDLEGYKGLFGEEWDLPIKRASEKSLGMPVGVQCVSSPYNEEVCLRLMKEIETLLGLNEDK